MTVGELAEPPVKTLLAEDMTLRSEDQEGNPGSRRTGRAKRGFPGGRGARVFSKPQGRI